MSKEKNIKNENDIKDIKGIKEGVKKKMIISKTDLGEYICKVNNSVFTIPSKSFYLAMKQDAENLREPTDEELIELGQKHHPFYQQSQTLDNINNTIQEIEEFEILNS